MKSDDLQPTRHSLLQRIKNLEDQDSWQDFFNTYWRLIYTVAARSGLNDAEAQDVVQDTVLTVVKNIQDFRPGSQHGSFRGWLLQTTRWRIADQRRKRSRASEPLHAPDETSRTSTAQRVPDPSSDDLDAHWESHWERNLMDAALEKVRAEADAEDYQLFERHVMELADDAGPTTEPMCPEEKKTAAVHDRTEISPTRYTPRTLKLELHRRTRLRVDECLCVGVALASALDFLHRQGLIHRDIKLSNIIFIRNAPRLADIGLVTTADATCSFVGTEGYFPPEGPGTLQADLFGLGKVLYEISTGRDRRDFPELPRDWASPEEEKAFLELNAIILRACKRDPRDRYASAAQLRADLLLLQSGKSVRRTHLLEERLATFSRVAGVLLVISVLATVAYFWASHQTRQAQANLVRAEKAESVLREQLRESMLHQARALRLSGTLGQRAEALAALGRAAAIRPGPDLRSEAVPCLGLMDARSFRRWTNASGVQTVFALNLLHERVVLPGGIQPNAFDFSPDSQTLATLCWDKTVAFWNVERRQSLLRSPITGGTRFLEFSADNRRLARFGDEFDAEILELTAPTAVFFGTGLRDPSLLMADVSADGQMIAYATQRGLSVRPIGTPGHGVDWPHGRMRAVRLLPDGRILVGGERGLFMTEVQRHDVAQPAWDLAAPVALWTNRLPEGSDDFSLTADTRTVMTRAKTNAAVVLDLSSNRPPVLLEPHTQLSYVALSAEGQWAATGSVRDADVKIWDARTGALLKVLSRAGPARVSFSVAGDRLIVTSQDTCSFYRAGDWELLRRIARPAPAPLTRLPRTVLSPNGALLAVHWTSDLTQLIHLPDGEPLMNLEGVGQTPLCFSADGARLYVLGQYAELSYWTLETIRQELAAVGLDWPSPGNR